MYAFNCKNARRSVSVEAMLLDRLQRRLCLLTCDRSSMMGELVVFLFSGLGFTFALMATSVDLFNRKFQQHCSWHSFMENRAIQLCQRRTHQRLKCAVRCVPLSCSHLLHAATSSQTNVFHPPPPTHLYSPCRLSRRRARTATALFCSTWGR